MVPVGFDRALAVRAGCLVGSRFGLGGGAGRVVLGVGGGWGWGCLGGGRGGCEVSLCWLVCGCLGVWVSVIGRGSCLLRVWVNYVGVSVLGS